MKTLLLLLPFLPIGPLPLHAPSSSLASPPTAWARLAEGGAVLPDDLRLPDDASDDGEGSDEGDDGDGGDSMIAARASALGAGLGRV